MDKQARLFLMWYVASPRPQPLQALLLDFRVWAKTVHNLDLSHDEAEATVNWLKARDLVAEFKNLWGIKSEHLQRVFDWKIVEEALSKQ